jgi:uncharacterized delta-60 repeat protein
MNVRRVMTIVLSFLALAVAGGIGNASAALRLDPSFGHAGLLLVPGQSNPERVAPEVVAQESDGGLILAGEGTLQRLDPAGDLDSSFGERGTVTVPPPAGGNFRLAAATVDAQGRIVVVGTSAPEQPERKPLPIHLNSIGEAYESEHTDIRILRYLQNGSLAASFGVGGIVESDLGLPTPEYEKVKLSAAPVVEATGLAIDGSGRIVVTGGAGASLNGGGCFHDDYYPGLSYVGLVARFTESGSLDKSFSDDGVFGGRSRSQIPLGMEVTTEPVITPSEEVILQRGTGHCSILAGSLGFFSLTAAGRVRAARGVHALHGRVVSAAAAADGSTVLLLGPEKGSEAPGRIVELLANGSLHSPFGHDGSAVLHLPDPNRSFLDEVRVAPDGEVLVQATVVPPLEKRESAAHWRSRFSVALLGLTAKGKHDPQIGSDGIVVKHIPHWYEPGGLWLDGQARPTITIGYRPKGEPIGLAAVRFEALG